MRTRREAWARIVLIGAFVTVIVVVLLLLAARAIDERCGMMLPGGCTAWTFFPAYWEVIGDFLDRNEGAIEACGTIFVAIFTFTLWTAT